MSKYKRYERYEDSGVEWIGEIPEHWEKMSLKMLASNEKNSFVDGPFGSDLKNEEYQDDGIPLIQLNNIVDGKHILQNLKYISEEKAQELCRHAIYPNDIVIAKMAYPVARAARVDEEYDKYVIVADCVRLRPNITKCDVRFLVYVINCPYVRSQAEIVASGTTRLRISLGSLKNLQVFLPTLDEQKSIADYLDQKTAEIDGLIADKEKLIELLQEKRQAIITEAVTKGLNPNVRMKDSGIEWIGEIPEHWNVEPIKYMVKTIQTGTTPTTKNDDYFDGDIQWFTPGDFHGSKELYEASRKISNLAVIDNEARLFPKNTVMIVGIGATVGKVAKLGVEGSFNQQITGLIVNEQRLNCDYLYYWLYINQETIKNISNYTTLPIINNEFVKNFECLSLPLDEQQAIVNYLNQKTSEIDDLILKIRLQIQKLKEYRQSLISEAVTGKIDVREFGSISEVI
ncbi:restriction endonuclease subunit S [Thermoanaerobacterium thermosaccharolyticum]|uniref:restriction endonuclease subunit S n=1 Tax=Thermoanaerobacterium thermosaccharolyticum TaxID=1517 RepID=UPI002FDA54CF